MVFSYRIEVSFRVLTSPKRKAKGFVKLFTIFTPLIRVISLEGTIIWESSSSPSLQTSPSSHYIRNDSYFSPRFSVELGPRTRVSRIKQSQMTFSDSLSKKDVEEKYSKRGQSRTLDNFTTIPNWNLQSQCLKIHRKCITSIFKENSILTEKTTNF